MEDKHAILMVKLTILIIWLFVSPLVISLLWNLSITDVFETNDISYWQSFAIVFMVMFLRMEIKVGDK